MMDELLADAAKDLALKVPDLGKGKTFEAVMLLKLAMSIAGKAGHCQARTHDGKRARQLLLRGAPGHIKASSARGKQAGYIAIDAGFGERSLEAHNSVEFVGASGICHEIDVCIVEEHHVAPLRKEEGGPIAIAPLLGVELKEYDPARTLDKNVTRAFLACILDLMPLRHVSSIRVGPISGGKDMGISHRPARFWIATTAQVGQPSVDLARFYDVQVAQQLTPASLDEAIEKMSWRVPFDQLRLS